MKIKFLNVALLALALAVFIYAVFFHDTKKPIRYLPVFGEKSYESKNGKTDTIFHTIPGFSFTDQDGNTVTEKNFENAVYVTDFFFTTCHSICPIMSTQMERVTRKFQGNTEVKFLSHTVDPEIDTVEQLKRYALKHNADSKQWMMVTGEKAKLYRIARQGYLLDAQEGNGGPDDFIHTQNFALIDKEKRIRGYYDGTDSLEIDQLMKDIDLLLKEYHYKEK
ncbi:MAG: SCO family protein [Bacteroidetes bacterium]|nr:SCO family protein [Bacteroidota bacterium]